MNLHKKHTLYVAEKHPSTSTEYRRVCVMVCPPGLRLVREQMPHVVAGPFPATPASLDTISGLVARDYGTTSAEWAVEDATRALDRIAGRIP